MRIHTTLDYVTMAGLTGPGKACGGRPLFVIWHRLEPFRSRTHPNAYEIRLEGSGGRNNTGRYGAGDYNGATWDEWGAVFGRLFALDPAARCGGSAARPVYACADDYHWQTGDRFRSGQLPADTHPRHRWGPVDYSEAVAQGYSEAVCQHKSGCTAVHRWSWRHTWAELVESGRVELDPARLGAAVAAS
jgi:hypothetical protein